MRLVRDYLHPTPAGRTCRVRVYLPESEEDAPVVILTEPRPNPRSPVLEYAGRIVSEILEGSGLENSRFPLLIQHNPTRGSFYLLVFSDPGEVIGASGRGSPLERVLGSPRWKPLERASVEKVLGEELR